MTIINNETIKKQEFSNISGLYSYCTFIDCTFNGAMKASFHGCGFINCNITDSLDDAYINASEFYGCTFNNMTISGSLINSTIQNSDIINSKTLNLKSDNTRILGSKISNTSLLGMYYDKEQFFIDTDFNKNKLDFVPIETNNSELDTFFLQILSNSEKEPNLIGHSNTLIKAAKYLNIDIDDVFVKTPKETYNNFIEMLDKNLFKEIRRKIMYN